MKRQHRCVVGAALRGLMLPQRASAPNPTAYPGEPIALLQQAAYPDLRGITARPLGGRNLRACRRGRAQAQVEGRGLEAPTPKTRRPAASSRPRIKRCCWAFPTTSPFASSAPMCARASDIRSASRYGDFDSRPERDAHPSLLWGSAGPDRCHVADDGGRPDGGCAPSVARL